ncbi:MAG TPA: hypothetical protein VN682_05515 [Terriglobales bacterium]|nr:hypothetical protein [Terriglobales bacterium]HXF13457.1 hypothetical protein [Terriglobales bacterium]
MTKKSETAPDPVAIDPEAYKVLFENEKVRVLEFRDRPGDHAKMHIHPERLIYSFTPWKRKFFYPDGRTELAEGKAGEIKWTAPVIHAGENIGETETHNLFIEFKDQPGKVRTQGQRR